MKLTGCVGIREGFQFQYQNLVGEGRVTEEALQALQPAMEQAVKAVRAIRSEGFSKAHLSKDGTPEHVYFPRQAYLAEGNPNDEASVKRLEELGAAWKDSVRPPERNSSARSISDRPLRSRIPQRWQRISSLSAIRPGKAGS